MSFKINLTKFKYEVQRRRMERGIQGYDDVRANIRANSCDFFHNVNKCSPKVREYLNVFKYTHMYTHIY